MSVPQLLVSVRSADEARLAAQAGADIIDLKDPQRGSLGMAGPDVIRQFCRTMSEFPHIPSSIALGELLNVPGEDKSAQQSVPAALQALPNSDKVRIPDFMKIGLAQSQNNADWQTEWALMRNNIQQLLNCKQGPEIQSDNSGQMSWIAVIYADSNAAQSANTNQILAAAVAAGCRGVLVDTFCKQSGRLTDHWSAPELEFCRQFTQQHDMLFAVAGRLRAKDVAEVTVCNPDVIAVRSAVCEQNDRKSALSANRIHELKVLVQKSIDGSSKP